MLRDLRPTSTTPGHLAIAVTREDPPRVFVAADEEALGWNLAVELVASEDPSVFVGKQLEAVREALLHERWADALALWMQATNTGVDVYPDEAVALQAPVEKQQALVEIRLGRVFSDPEHRP